MSSILIQNGLVVTMNPRCQVFQGSVYVENDRILELPSARTTADLVIAADNMLVLPGMIQIHVHLGQTLFRGLADDLDVVDWLRLKIWPLEQAHDEQSVYDSARLAIAEMVKGGTTAALTVETVAHTDAAFEAALDCGFRATIGKALMDLWEPGTEMVGEDTSLALADSLQLLHKYHGAGNGRLRCCFAPRGVRNATDELWRSVHQLAAEYKTVIHSHAEENRAQTERLQRAFGQHDIQYLYDLGVTGPNLVLAHCVWSLPEEIEVLAKTGTCVAHCPSANLKLASGIAPIPEMLDAGVTVGLGSDGAACNNSLDVFQELRLAALIHKPRRGAAAMPAWRVLRMATSNGARALGLASEIGSLEPGKKADIILLRRDELHTYPNVQVDPVAQVVYEHRASDVDTVVIDGKVVLQGGHLVDLNESEIRRRAQCSSRRLIERVARH